MDLGFTREDSDDELFFDQYGYGYFFCVLNLTKHIDVEWSPTTREARVLRTTKGDQRISGEIVCDDLDKLKEIIEFFTGDKRKGNWPLDFA